MIERKLLEDVFSLRGECDKDFALISFIAGAYNETALNEAINQFDRAMMLDLQAFGQLTDGGLAPARQAFQGEQQLVLLRLKAARTNGLFTQTEKATKLVAKLGQRLVIGRRYFFI